MANTFSNNIIPKPIHEMLSGRDAFYNRQAEVNEEFSSDFPKQTDYTVNLDSRIYRFAKTLFDYTIGLPITIMHGLIGCALLQATPITYFSDSSSLQHARKNAVANMNLKGFEVKRITLNVDGYRVDAQIIGKKDTLTNGKWTLFAGGNAMLCNESESTLLPFLEETNNNLITFNYPTVAGSPDMFPSKEGCYKAVQGLLEMLEDKDNGVGATDVTVWGLSFGGGAIGEALSRHTPKDGIKYAVVKDRTFAEMADVVHEFGTKITRNSILPDFLRSTVVNIIWLAVKVFGWNLYSAASIDTFKAPEYILQQAIPTPLMTSTHPTLNMTDVDQLELTDNVISKDCSLAKRVFSEEFVGKRDNVNFVGLLESHNQSLFNATQKELGKKIVPLSI